MKKNWFVELAFLFVILVTAGGISAGPTLSAGVPHTFKPGELVSSKRMNENFQALSSRDTELCRILEDLRLDVEALRISISNVGTSVGAQGPRGPRGYPGSDGENGTIRDIADLRSDIASLTDCVNKLKEKTNGISQVNSTVIFEGVNVVIRDAGPGQPCAPGLGNLLLGRDDPTRFANHYGRDPIRTGCNNLIIGGSNEWSGSHGLCVGQLNKLNGDGCALFSCENEAKGEFNTIHGGTGNKVNGSFSAISGGCNKHLNGYCRWGTGNSGNR